MLFIMFIVKFETNEEFDIENMMDPDKAKPEVMRANYLGELYQNALKEWLPFLNKRGFIDSLLPHQPLTPFMSALMQQMQTQSPPPPAQSNVEE